jgi:hypothetical protein
VKEDEEAAREDLLALIAQNDVERTRADQWMRYASPYMLKFMAMWVNGDADKIRDIVNDPTIPDEAVELFGRLARLSFCECSERINRELLGVE